MEPLVIMRAREEIYPVFQLIVFEEPSTSCRASNSRNSYISATKQHHSSIDYNLINCSSSLLMSIIGLAILKSLHGTMGIGTCISSLYF